MTNVLDIEAHRTHRKRGPVSRAPVVVLCKDVAAVLRDEIGLYHRTRHADWRGRLPDPVEGEPSEPPLDSFYARVGLALGTTEDSARRLCVRILQHEQVTVGAPLYDKLALEFDWPELPVHPGSITSAMKMLRERHPRMAEKRREKAARSMYDATLRAVA